MRCIDYARGITLQGRELVKPIDFRIALQVVTHSVWRSVASRN